MGLKIAAGICFALAIPFALIYYFTALSTNTAEVRGNAGEKERVVADPGYRLANRDEFYEKCADIQATNEKIENWDAQAKAATDDFAKQQALDGKFAAEQQKQDLVADYNGMAENVNRGAFRQAELPPHIDPDDMEVECS